MEVEQAGPEVFIRQQQGGDGFAAHNWKGCGDEAPQKLLERVRDPHAGYQHWDFP